MPEIEKIHVAAHSRGTDIATTALRELIIETRAKGLDPRAHLKIENLVLSAADIDVDIDVSIRVGLSVSATACDSASRIWPWSCPSMVITLQPHASYFAAVSSWVTSSVGDES